MAIGKPLESLRNVILKNVALLEENPLEGDPTFVTMQEILELNRTAENGLRDRMFVLMVANKDSWKLAGMVAKRKAGIVKDEEYAVAKKQLGSTTKVKFHQKCKTDNQKNRERK